MSMAAIELVDNSRRIRQVGLMAGDTGATLAKRAPGWAEKLMARILESLEGSS